MCVRAKVHRCCRGRRCRCTVHSRARALAPPQPCAAVVNESCQRERERERKDRRIGGARARRQHKARPVSNDVISLVSQRVNNYAVSRPFSCGPLRPPSPPPPGLFTPPQDVRPRIEIRDRHCCVEPAGQFSISRARGNRGSWRGSFTLPVSLLEIIFLFRRSLIRR